MVTIFTSAKPKMLQPATGKIGVILHNDIKKIAPSYDKNYKWFLGVVIVFRVLLVDTLWEKRNADHARTKRKVSMNV